MTFLILNFYDEYNNNHDYHNDNGALPLKKNPGSAPDSVVSCKLGPSCHISFERDGIEIVRVSLI